MSDRARRALRRRIVLMVLAALGGCTGSAEGGEDAAATSAPDSTTVAAVPSADAGADRFAQRVVVFMEASAEEIEAVRAELSEEDFATVADDLSFYRATAHEYLEARGWPVVRLTGRRPLTFRVGAVDRRFDYRDIPWLDIIVLYDEGGEPRAIAPNEVELAETYFAGVAADSSGR